MAGSGFSIGVFQILVTLFLGLIGLYLAHNLQRQLKLRITDKRLDAYAALWRLMEVASDTRLEGPNPKPLTPEEREHLFNRFVSWYYQDGHGMLLGASTRAVYLEAKKNLVRCDNEFEPKYLRDNVLLALPEEKRPECRGRLAITQLSLLRTRMKADLAVYGPHYFRKLTDEDKAFLDHCGEQLWRRPWGSLRDIKLKDIKLGNIKSRYRRKGPGVD
jgi:hypothetical protein